MFKQKLASKFGAFFSNNEVFFAMVIKSPNTFSFFVCFYVCVFVFYFHLCLLVCVCANGCLNGIWCKRGAKMNHKAQKAQTYIKIYVSTQVFFPPFSSILLKTCLQFFGKGCQCKKFKLK